MNQGQRPSRICVCVVMTHPYPRNIPLLRKLYAGKFSHLLFMMPMERSDDPDVLTVYRSSYTHGAYVTDVRERLSAVDCDYYLLVHDDVLLNPSLREENFRELFPLGPDDGFIPRADRPGDHIGHRAWYLGPLAKLLFPKSLLFGSGVDAANLVKYMPDAERLRARLDAAGVVYQDRVLLDQEDFDGVAAEASRVLLHGHVLPASQSSAQVAAEAACLALERGLVEAMAAGVMTERTRGAPDAAGQVMREVPLPFPMLDSYCYADLVIIPKSRFDDYAHYMGVSATANLWVEHMIPTVLYAVCERVWTSAELGLDGSFFDERNSLSHFLNPRFLAINPVKLSQFAQGPRQDAFLEIMGAIGEGRVAWPPVAEVGPLVLEDLLATPGQLGWHGQEDWGRWAWRERAVIPFVVPPHSAVAGLRLTLAKPCQGRAFTGSVGVEGRAARPVRIAEDDASLVVDLDAAQFSLSENRIEIISDELVRPIDADPGGGDGRTLGFGLAGCAFF